MQLFGAKIRKKLQINPYEIQRAYICSLSLKNDSLLEARVLIDWDITACARLISLLIELICAIHVFSFLE